MHFLQIRIKIGDCDLRLFANLYRHFFIRYLNRLMPAEYAECEAKSDASADQKNGCGCDKRNNQAGISFFLRRCSPACRRLREIVLGCRIEIVLLRRAVEAATLLRCIETTLLRRAVKAALLRCCIETETTLLRCVVHTALLRRCSETTLLRRAIEAALLRCCIYAIGLRRTVETLTLRCCACHICLRRCSETTLLRRHIYTIGLRCRIETETTLLRCCRCTFHLRRCPKATCLRCCVYAVCLRCCLNRECIAAVFAEFYRRTVASATLRTNFAVIHLLISSFIIAF